MEDKITIIMPIYNSENYLKRSIESALSQTYKNIELLCIDDCSTDNSLEILKRYQNLDSRIKIISFKENQGQGIARNEALKQANGNYIMFLDSDDSLELNACELAINQIVKNNNDFVFFNFTSHYENKKSKISTILTPFLKEENNFHINPTEQKINMFHNFFVWVGIYKKSFILENNIFFNSSKLCEDDIFYIKCCLFAKDISIINQPLYNYFVRENSSSFQTQDYKKILIAKKECWEECKKHYNDTYLRLNYVKYYIDILLFYLKKFSMLNRKIEKEFFYEVKKVFRELDKEENIDFIKSNINIVIFNRIKNCSFFSYKLLMFLEKIFLIRRFDDNLIIKFLGKTIKTKTSQEKRIYKYKTAFAEYINVRGHRFKLKRNSYKDMYIQTLERNEQLLEVIEYFKKIVPINMLPKMTGELRELQLRILDFVKKLCFEFERNDIQYFLVAGSAIGAKRHAGFIPWDDDIDIGMMREDYTKCEKFLKDNFAEVDISHLKLGKEFKEKKYEVLIDAFEKYPNKIFFIKTYNMLQIFYGVGLNNFVSLDIFSFDYYRDDYSFEEHKEYYEALRYKLVSLKNHGCAMEYIKKELQTNPNIVNKSNTIYFAIDSDISNENVAKGFYDADKIFPLQKVGFEDTSFYVASDVDFYIKNELGNYMSWPNNINLSAHVKTREKHINIIKKQKKV